MWALWSFKKWSKRKPIKLNCSKFSTVATKCHWSELEHGKFQQTMLKKLFTTLSNAVIVTLTVPQSTKMKSKWEEASKKPWIKKYVKEKIFSSHQNSGSPIIDQSTWDQTAKEPYKIWDWIIWICTWCISQWAWNTFRPKKTDTQSGFMIQNRKSLT